MPHAKISGFCLPVPPARDLGGIVSRIAGFVALRNERCAADHLTFRDRSPGSSDLKAMGRYYFDGAVGYHDQATVVARALMICTDYLALKGISHGAARYDSCNWCLGKHC